VPAARSYFADEQAAKARFSAFPSSSSFFLRTPALSFVLKPAERPNMSVRLPAALPNPANHASRRRSSVSRQGRKAARRTLPLDPTAACPHLPSLSPNKQHYT